MRNAISTGIVLAVVFILAVAGPAVAAGDGAAGLVFAGGDFRTLMAVPAQPAQKLRSRVVVDLDPAQAYHPKAPEGDLGHHDNFTVIRDVVLSPDGRHLVVQADMGPQPMTWIVRADDRTGESARALIPEGFGFFLGWHPNSRQVLFKALDTYVADAGLWLVDIHNGRHRRLDTPALPLSLGLAAAAFASDGSTFAYAFTAGMGTGSEIWMSDLEGSFHRRLHREPNGVVGSLVWSPEDSDLAFNTLYDSPVPFAEAGLWVYETRRDAVRWLGLMDGGHGEEPIWSADGRELYFVARENLDDPQADHVPEKLVSSIRAVELESLRQTVLMKADGARQIDLARGPDGDLLFASNRAGGALEIWTVDPFHKSGAVQLTFDGVQKRHPAATPGR